QFELVRVRVLFDLKDLCGDDLVAVPLRADVGLLDLKPGRDRQPEQADVRDLEPGQGEPFDEVRERDPGEVHVLGEPLEWDFHVDGPATFGKGESYGRPRPEEGTSESDWSSRGEKRTDPAVPPAGVPGRPCHDILGWAADCSVAVVRLADRP